ATISSGLRDGMAQPADLSKIGSRRGNGIARHVNTRWRQSEWPGDRHEAVSDEPPDFHDGGGLDDEAGPTSGSPSGDHGRPLIHIVGGEMNGIVDRAEAALIACNPEIYRYGGQLVRPVVEEVPAADMTVTKTHRLTPLTRPALVERFTAAAVWAKYDRRARKWVPVDCPDKFAEVYLARERWHMPPLVGIINAPLLRSDGSLLDKPG